MFGSGYAGALNAVEEIAPRTLLVGTDGIDAHLVLHWFGRFSASHPDLRS